ncbi:YitT family protein [Synergistaceae bacterium OttesenSCG-928-D05]|nr:YitT family protein [Synergistaceae bacterium OttesenSCG-928-D05]
MTRKQHVKRIKNRVELFCLGEWSTLLISTIGSLLYSIGVTAFTLPYHFPDSGVMGIAVILKYTIGLAPSLVSLVANVGLLLWGGRELSKRFVGWTIYNVLLISFFLQALDAVPYPMIQDMFLVAIAGGVIKGIGAGLVFRTGTSMGGLDVVVAVMRKRLGVEVGQMSFYFNTFILAASAGFVGFEKMLYGFVSSYVVGQVMDSVLTSFDKRRLVFIVTQDAKAIADYIASDLHRGSTLLHGSGGYSGGDYTTVMCLMNPRQAMVLKRYLAKEHPRSFMAITDASEVLGNGFKRWKHV